MKIKGIIRDLLSLDVLGALVIVGVVSAALTVKWDGITGMTHISEILYPELKLRRAQKERIGDRSPQVLVHLMDEAGGLKETLYEAAGDEFDLLKFLGSLDGRRPLSIRSDLDHYYARVVVEVTDDPSWKGGPEDPNTTIEVLVTHPGGSAIKEVKLEDPLRWEGSIAKILPRTGWNELEFLHMELEFDEGGVKPGSGLSLGLR